MLELYHNDMSTCAQKVRLTLAEKGLSWENRHLDLRAGEQQKPDYLAQSQRCRAHYRRQGESRAGIYGDHGIPG
jgi:hypothetical protein